MASGDGPTGADERVVHYRVLGPVQAERDGELLRYGGAKARALLAMLVLDVNRVVPVSRLIDGVWGEEPPDGVQASLHVHISNLRKAIGPAALETRAPGYLLHATTEAVDLLAFEDEVARARTLADAGELVRARGLLTSALGRFEGPVLGNVRDAPFAATAVAWLDERHALAFEDQAEILLATGDHRQAVPELELALGETPDRERLWGQLMVALYRSGRQADALKAFQRAREVLGDLGLDVGAELRELETAVLLQDAALLEPTSGPSRPGASSVATDVGPTFRVSPGVSAFFELDDGRRLELLDGVVIGRSPTCDVHLAEGAVSRQHAEVRPALGGHLLIDLKSTNGTTVNGRPVSEHLLVDGDEIAIGGHVLRYRMHGG